MTARGRFISLEGGEGVGKSTQAAALAEALRARGHEVVLTREPGGSPGAEAIRALLLEGAGDRWTPEAEALLFAAARADHVARTIRPALERGRWVVCDRFVDSSRSYQGGADGVGDAAVLALHRVGSDGLLPAPPHDAAGHTWQHGNAQLYELIAHSVANIAPPGYRTGMPAFADKLTPAEIWAVIAFIKAQWPPGVRAYQDAQNPGAPPLAELPGDWTFPTTCDIHAWEAAAPASPAVGAAPPAR